MRSFSPLGKSLGASLHSLLIKILGGYEVAGTAWVPPNWISLSWRYSPLHSKCPEQGF
jgi:hypothetical protein